MKEDYESKGNSQRTLKRMTHENHLNGTTNLSDIVLIGIPKKGYPYHKKCFKKT